MSIRRREFLRLAGAAAIAPSAVSQSKDIPYAVLQPAAGASLRNRLDSSVLKQVDASVVTANQKRKSGRGVKTIISGPAGSERTLAAQVFASGAGRDLYVVDLSRVISKYIGETEKNLERVFAEAEQSNVVLLFDEADALFGNRADTQDTEKRYAHLDMTYLLQRLEEFTGVAILATNSVAKLDQSLVRRCDAVITFSNKARNGG